MNVKRDHFSLANFEGQLDILICLIQKEEIEIQDIFIQEMIQQFLLHFEQQDQKLDIGAEFIGSAAYLLWLKSKNLLPDDQQIPEEEPIEDPRFEIIHHLIDYCRFKQAAKELSSRQEKQQSCYFRGIEIPKWKKPLGIDHVSLEELSLLFKEMSSKAIQNKPQIQDENWRVSDKIKAIRILLHERSSFPFINLFHSQQSRAEMIVLFLAVLELMKIGDIIVGRDQASSILWICSKDTQ